MILPSASPSLLVESRPLQFSGPLLVTSFPGSHADSEALRNPHTNQAGALAGSRGAVVLNTFCYTARA